MPQYYLPNTQFQRNAVFGSSKPGKLSDDQLDLPSKLSILLKKGLGRTYVTPPKQLDAPTKKKHQQYLRAQFEKATYDHFIKALTVDIDRKKSFEDFNSMDYTPEIASALDIYADESLTKSENDEILTITCDNPRIKKVLENLFVDVLDINHNLWHWTRNTCKYGNEFLLLDVQPNRGVCGWLQITNNEMRREEAWDGDINSLRYVWEPYDVAFDNWQIAHFRLIKDQTRIPYGTSALESTRLIWKQLTLAEDAMMVYRISRAPERRVFYIDVGNIDPDDVAQYIQDIKNQIKRTPLVQEPTGSVDFRYNSMAIDEDFFIPRRNDKNSEIDTLPGASNLDEIADIEYMQKKLFASLKIPKAFLTFDEDVNAKATLASEDFRFARTINRIQQAILTTLNQIAMIHLFALGFRDKDQLYGFKLELTNPSTQTEIEQMEIWEQKAAVFSALWNEATLSPFSYVQCMREIFHYNDNEIKMILKQQYLEGKMKLAIEEVSTPEELDMETSEASSAGGFVDQSGKPLPSEPPAGMEYADATTGDVVESRIQEMIDLLQEVRPALGEVRVKKISSRVTHNTLSMGNVTTMLETLKENIETAPQRIQEAFEKVKNEKSKSFNLKG